MSRRPFEDLLALVQQLPIEPEPETSCSERVSDLGSWLARSQNSGSPSIREVHICVLASSYAKDDAQDAETESVQAFIESASKGQAEVNGLCKPHGLGLRVLELAPSLPHTVGTSWNEAECVAATAFGMEATAAGGDLLCLGSFSTYDQFYALRFLEALETLEVKSAGVDPAGFLDSLRVHGGRDMAAALGAMLAAKSRSLPVVIEGWAALCAYSVFKKVAPNHIAHIKLGAVNNIEQKQWAEKLGLTPIMGLLSDSGPGCGLALAASMIVVAHR